MTDRHRFRFFTDEACGTGDVIALSQDDAAHLQVVRLAVGDELEVVDAAGQLWAARVEDPAAARVRVGAALAAPEVGRIELFAGALVGGRFDELIDGAVQAGADLVVPVAWSSRDAARLRERQARLTRIAVAAAKQAKRIRVPEVAEPITFDRLLADVAGGGVVLDARAGRTMDEVLAARGGAGPVRLLVGPSNGILESDLTRLASAGWVSARLGPSVLRSELAAAVAVAVASMAESR